MFDNLLHSIGQGIKLEDADVQIGPSVAEPNWLTLEYVWFDGIRVLIDVSISDTPTGEYRSVEVKLHNDLPADDAKKVLAMLASANRARLLLKDIAFAWPEVCPELHLIFH